MTGEEIKSMWRHAYKFLSYIWSMKFKVVFNILMMYSDRRGTDKNHPRRNLPDKRPPDKTPRTKTPANNWERIVQRALVGVFSTRPTKNGGVRDVWRTFGGVRDMWQSVTGRRGSKLAKNSVTYFMDAHPYVSRTKSYRQFCDIYKKKYQSGATSKAAQIFLIFSTQSLFFLYI